MSQHNDFDAVRFTEQRIAERNAFGTWVQGTLLRISKELQSNPVKAQSICLQMLMSELEVLQKKVNQAMNLSIEGNKK